MRNIQMLLFAIGLNIVAAYGQPEPTSAYSEQYRLPLLYSGDSIGMDQFSGYGSLLYFMGTPDEASTSEILACRELVRLYDGKLKVLVVLSSSLANSQPIEIPEEALSILVSDTCIKWVNNVELAGAGAHPLFAWLADFNQNQRMHARVNSNRTKIILNTEGQIVGYFNSEMIIGSEIFRDILVTVLPNR